jgi:2-polyprenyl-3-methyl-5-hydroxy-6-metoxy-1,4-benzoquinol methylase
MEPLLSSAARAGRRSTILPYVRGRVLDIGCGWTTLPDQLPEVEAYVGVDNVPDAVAFSSRRYPEHTFLLRDVDTEGLAVDGPAFDTVIMTALVEHLHHPGRVLADVQALLAPGGRVIITTPTRWGDLAHQIGGRIGLFYAESVVKHVHIFGRDDLHTLVADCGYEVEAYRSFALGANHLLVCRARPAAAGR